MRNAHYVISSLFILALAACGGSEATDGDEVVDYAPEGGNETAGEEQVTEPPTENVAEPDPIPTGPVDVTVTLRVGTDDVEGTVALINEAGETVAEGNGGQTFNVQSGAYQVSATIADASVLIDTPTVTQDAQLTAGETQTVEVTFPRARILLNVTRGGRALRRPEVTLYRQGSEEPAASFRVGQNHVPISPGRYEADVKLRGHEIRVRGLTFMDGATQSIPVNIE